MERVGVLILAISMFVSCMSPQVDEQMKPPIGDAQPSPPVEKRQDQQPPPAAKDEPIAPAEQNQPPSAEPRSDESKPYTAVVDRRVFEELGIPLRNISEPERAQRVEGNFSVSLRATGFEVARTSVSGRAPATAQIEETPSMVTVRVTLPEPGEYRLLITLRANSSSPGHDALLYEITSEPQRADPTTLAPQESEEFRIAVNSSSFHGRLGLSRDDFQFSNYRTEITGPFPMGFRAAAGVRADYRVYRENPFGVSELVERSVIDHTASDGDLLEYTFRPETAGLYHVDIKISSPGQPFTTVQCEVYAPGDYFATLPDPFGGRVPNSLASGLEGEWNGTYISNSRGTNPRFVRLAIDEVADGALATAVVSSRMSPAEVDRAVAGNLPADESFVVNRYAAEQLMKVRVANDHVELFPITWELIHGAPAFLPDMVGFTLHPAENSTIQGHSYPIDFVDDAGLTIRPTDGVLDLTNFKAERRATDGYGVAWSPEVVGTGLEPGGLTPGRVQTLAVRGNPQITYQAYIPTGFRSSRPTVIVANQAPSGNAEPLAIEAAEQLNWVSVGLPDFRNGTSPEGHLLSKPDSYFAILDLLSRFTIEPRGLILAGFSEGAKLAVEWANYFRGFVGGVVDLDMGAWRTQNLDRSVPVYSVVANQNNRRDDWIASARTVLASEYAWGRIELFDGPHSWGPALLHDEALFWLAEIRDDPQFRHGQ